MIKRLFILSLLLWFTGTISAQQYGNEWINYSQKHYRINIPKTGLYRIDYATLISYGVPLSTINPKNFQLFIKGEEQHIYINGEADNTFDLNDYIEFFARKNDARSDSTLYFDVPHIPNPYMAMFNDTNCAFLTWNALLTNKRVTPETDINFLGYTPTDYFYTEKIKTSQRVYSLGVMFADAVTDPRYVTAEGYGDTTLYKGGVATTNFGNLNVYQSPTLPVHLKVSYSGSSKQEYPYIVNPDHQIKVQYFDNAGNYMPLSDTSFYGHRQILVSKQLVSSQLQNNSHIRVLSENLAGLNNNSTTNIHYYYLKYPQKPDLQNASEKTLFIDDNASSLKTFLDLQNVNIGTAQIIFYDLTNHKYISSVASGSNVKVLIPNSSSQKECFLTTTANINYVTALKPVNQTGFFVNYKTTNPDSAFLIITHKSILSGANAYKNYRQSSAGGSHHVILAEINDLYDQFAYGNIQNPSSIRNFCRYLSDSLPTPPKYLLLLGKSIKNSLTRSNIAYWNSNLVPTIGYPSSDNLLTAKIHGSNSSTPFIPTGRISAKDTIDITKFLKKLDSHESGLKNIVPDDWHKRVMHFSGGVDLAQQQAFESYLYTFGNIIKDTLYGAKIFSFHKNTTAPIQITVSDSVAKLINYGTSMITFFGHGSVSGFDQAIDDPTIYQNKDKYPLFLANSCYSGDIHLPGASSTSENFTLIEDKGSIGFIASSSAGVVNTLHNFTQQFYKAITYETYTKGIGDAIKFASFNNSFPTDQLQQITNLEMTLEGDPSVKLNGFAKPDYKIENSSVSFNISTYPDSIGINIYIKNLGRAIRDTFIVRTERYYPSGDSITFFRKIKAPANDTTIRFFILKDYENGVGLNHFKVYIDSYNEIDELSETNNSTTGTVDLIIPGGDVIPVYPYKYAIIPAVPQITLKATTADPFAAVTNYKIQLDTCDAFTNPINSTIISSAGGVINWTVNLPLADSAVYFWRISKDSTSITDKFNWRESSFQVINNKFGWGQSHFHQFKNDKYQFVKYKKSLRKFEFENDVISVICRNGFLSGIPWDQITYSLNTTMMHVWSCTQNGWSIAIFDPTSGSPNQSYPLVPGATGPGQYNNCHCVNNQPLYAFDFGTNTSVCGISNSWQTDLENLLSSLQPGTKVLAYSQLNHQSSSFGAALINQFQSIGSANITTVTDTVPIIIFGEKGFVPGQAHEVIGARNNSAIILNDTIHTNWTNGYIESEIIGPSTKWNSLHWKQQSLELPTNDSIILKVIGIKADGTKVQLATFGKDSTDVLDLYNYVPAALYPKLQLVAYMKDSMTKTPPQLKKWQVIYDPVPECAINPQQGFANNSSIQAIQEGENLIVRLPIQNIGSVPFNDSLVVTYWIEDANRVIHPLPQKMKANPFVPAQVIIDTIAFNSLDFPGLNYLWVDVNPEAHPRHQLEQYHFNNIVRIGFNVSKDNINPLLDVTFDGSHILNGDIISSKPHVLITLKDENRFLALNDTSKFAVFIKHPNQPAEKRLFFSNTLQFTPAQLPNNSCKIEWRPEFAEDGKYKMIVQATDMSKNVSGAVDYNIQFEIVNKQTVTEVLNYPNPFSTSTRFVFTLTGSEVPDVFIIQIMTITGKVVKEITKNELGNLHIGRNLTSYTWDGKDDFGDKLANGVYLYRVITRHNGQAVEKRETDADSFFKRGIGKLVIMR